ncbi:uncharacterized protein AMSG_00124 [Thecamonas trahens ATCC 50062]|uniref:Uncharacterized protein n=1 Tax=Thecamonas trahens ATCC 50062 TaxID=461836 RepID=A0A0L0D1A5_THETB|nr:hypothetical protein AMSG_00124 [Thecamonas trahens ATCC 50062]KNC46006.1 hypothetical protein AMSG_00124 [Thecamonas trahens ATCC 50062]|eukprot:XP_013762986.1 hypothetical protein AMSG_00124 [Thecamonas trahens ATCC 50062]
MHRREANVDLLHRIAYSADNIHSARDVVSLARSCKSIHAALLGTPWARTKAHAHAGIRTCLSLKLWAGATRLVARAAAAGAPPIVSGMDVKIAFGAPRCAEWRAFVLALGRAGVSSPYLGLPSWLGELLRIVYSDVRGFLFPLPIAVWAAVRGEAAIAAELAPGVTGHDADALLIAAAYVGDRALVATVTLSCSGLDVERASSLALVAAAGVGALDLVDELLTNAHVDPTVNNQAAVIAAARHGHPDVLTRLLADMRVDPSARDSEALFIAAAYNKIDAVALLVADGRANPCTRNCAVIRKAAVDGRTAVVQLLLDSGRIPPDVAAELSGAAGNE